MAVSSHPLEPLLETKLMKNLVAAAIVLVATIIPAPTVARAETRQDWISLGARVHGGFGAFIPVGIRIGLDALERLKAQPRDVTVTYLDSDKAPCACILDGIMIATAASPGQRTLHIAPEKAPAGSIAVAIVRHKRTGESIRYAVAESWMAQLAEWNKTLNPAGRYDAVMKADGLFVAIPIK